MYTMDETPGAPQGGGAGGLGAGLLMAGAQIYDTSMQRKTARENTDKTIAAQKAEAELAYQRQIEMWNMQNAYNSPVAQMGRFKAAGLNPHLIYGQGNAGNASSTPNYQAPNIQYRYEAGQMGQAAMSVLPTLMQVGTWMQDMRLKEATLAKTQESTQLTSIQQEQLRQMIEYLYEKNPRMLRDMDNKLSLFPYQYEVQKETMHQANLKTSDLFHDLRYKYGDEMVEGISQPGSVYFSKNIGGAKGYDLISREAKARLDRAKASWTDFDITNPQAIMQLVMSGVMGMAGQTLRLSTVRRPKVTHETESRMRGGRVNVRRRIYEK